MCHVLLSLPVLALALFWLLPLWVAAPVYAVVAVSSAVIYLKILQAMKHPAEAGLDALLRSTGDVRVAEDGRIRVLVHGEYWNARSPDPLHVGDRVRVTGIDGMTLTVRRNGRSAGPCVGRR